MSEKKLPLFNKCTRDGCNGEIDFADMAEVYDAAKGSKQP